MAYLPLTPSRPDTARQFKWRFTESQPIQTVTLITTNGFVVLPYVNGVSERIGRLLKQQSLRVSYKPQRTINSLFSRPKQQDKTDRASSGVVYRINCSQCDFVYYGQTERSLKTRVSERKKAVMMFDQNSKLACHVHERHHRKDFINVKSSSHGF